MRLLQENNLTNRYIMSSYHSSKNKPTGQQTDWEDIRVVGDAALRFTARLVQRSAGRMGNLMKDTHRAFQQGLDPTIDDAVILDEYEETPDSTES